jgi:hypothetical protein
VHALDDSVDREHLDPVALRLDDRRIVADADQDPGGRRKKPLLDAGDELAFGLVCDSGRAEHPRSYFA